MTAPRFAVYFAPDPKSAWWHAGCTWLGRDALGGPALAQPRFDGFDSSAFARITAGARRYGWHATLKPPFRLAAGIDEAQLRARMVTLAATLAPAPLGTLRAAMLWQFIALVPQEASPTLTSLAARCVVELDDLRAAPLEADLSRHRAPTLAARPNELLDRYGYPFVLDCFRFHFSLTGVLAPGDAHRVEPVLAAARVHFYRLNTSNPLLLDRLSSFVESEPGAPLRRVADFALRGHL